MKENERAAIEKAERITTELEKSPLLKKLRADEATATLSKRTAAAERIESLRREMEGNAGKQIEIDDMVEELAALDAVRRELQEKIGQKRYTFAVERSGIEGESRQQNEILLSTYDEIIDEGIQFFLARHDKLREPGKISINRLGGERNIFTETVNIMTESNVEAINSALRYCMNAVNELEAMKLCPAVDLQRIEALKTGIPRIDVYTKAETEKPTDKGVNPSFLAKMANEMDDRINRLLGKRARA